MTGEKKILVTKRGLVIFCGTLLFWAVIAWCSPLSSDDLEFALNVQPTFNDKLAYVLHYGNGRFLGNLGALYMCSSRLLRTCVKAGVISGIILLIPVVLKKYTPFLHAVVFTLFAGISGVMFAETITWTSGFQNYFPPILMTLLILYLINNIEGEKYFFARIILIAVIGFAGQLYIEISTVLNIFLAFVLCINARYRKKKVRFAYCLVWTVTSVLGAGIMYIIPKLYEADNAYNTQYRSTSFGSIDTLIKTAVSNCLTISDFFFGNVLLCVMISICGLIAVKKIREVNKNLCWIYFQYTLIISMTYCIINHFISRNEWYGHLGALTHALHGGFVVLPLIIWIIAIINVETLEMKKILISIIGIAVFAILPMLVVNPIHIRVTLLSNVFLIAAITLYIGENLSSIKVYCRYIKQIFTLGTAVMCFCIILMFFDIRWLDVSRDQYIKNQMEKGATEICIYPIPYDYVMWDGTNIYRWEYYYNKVGDITFTSMDYDEWSYTYR